MEHSQGWNGNSNGNGYDNRDNYAVHGNGYDSGPSNGYNTGFNNGYNNNNGPSNGGMSGTWTLLKRMAAHARSHTCTHIPAKRKCENTNHVSLSQPQTST